MVNLITQNSFLRDYSKTSVENIKLKKQIVNLGQLIKRKLIDNKSPDSNINISSELKNIAIKIQKKINCADLSGADLKTYTKEIKKLVNSTIEKEIENFLHCCIILSKHDTKSDTKCNYFGITNKTASLLMFIETNDSHEGIQAYDPKLLSGLIEPALQDQHWQYRQNKFKFSYSKYDLSIKQKLIEEDQYALKQLNDINIKTNVKDIINKLVIYLEKNISRQQDFVDTINKYLNDSSAKYPLIKSRFNNFSELLTYLSTNESTIELLSIMWLIFVRENRPNDESIELIVKIYIDIIVPTRDYKEYERKPLADNFRFGNSKTIANNLFNSDIFPPFLRNIDYKKVNSTPSNSIIKKMQAKGIPYICGISGMANMFCVVLNVLNIHPYSDEGKLFCEAAAAFIVGSGMHPYYEVYKSFNLYAKAIDGLLTLD